MAGTVAAQLDKRINGTSGRSGAGDPAQYRFLLDREPSQSISGRFDIAVISRYFPEFEERLPAWLAPEHRAEQRNIDAPDGQPTAWRPTLMADRTGFTVAALRFAVAALLITGAAAVPAAELTFIWEDRFSAAEQTRLVTWLTETQQAVEALVGPLPVPVHVHLHRRAAAREPVPWAHTERHRAQGVHFHVDPGFPLASLRADWTAAHELSHLVLPYLGRDHAWFSEGFASHMQYQVMRQMGVLSAEEAERRYRRKLKRAQRQYPYPEETFVEAAPRLRATGRYPVMYWGGAAYFRQVDQALRARDSSLLEVLREYLACCRQDRATLTGLLKQLDGLAEQPVFSVQYRRFASRPGFPAG